MVIWYDLLKACVDFGSAITLGQPQDKMFENTLMDLVKNVRCDSLEDVNER